MHGDAVLGSKHTFRMERGYPTDILSHCNMDNKTPFPTVYIKEVSAKFDEN